MIHSSVYRVFQEECEILRESVPYVKLYRYNPKHLYPKLKPFYYQLMHTMLKNTELLKHSKITLQHVSVYVETIFRELQSVLG